MPPLTDKCRLSICIPVAAVEEADYIYTALSSFTNQTAEPDSFEIVLFLNCVNSDSSNVALEKTFSEIARFRENHPEIQLHAFYRELPKTIATIGYIRKLLNDSVLYRHFKREGELGEHILVRADADTRAVNPRFVESYSELFDEHPNVDSFFGKTDWDWESYLSDPVYLVSARMFISIERYMHRRADLSGSGPNFAVRAARYADAGGYRPDKDLAEDVQLSQDLKIRRLWAKDHRAIQSAGFKGPAIHFWKKSALCLQEWNFSLAAVGKQEK